MEITILCKVVDNFGDIGVNWRLAKKLKSLNPASKINLIVDNLSSFNKICADVKTGLPLQSVCGIEVYDWNAYDFCYGQFAGENNRRLQVILECFQCGRPDWMEKILFDDELNHTVQIIMIDYLSAEDYAESFHKLQSLTRRGKVKKVNFMPGFTAKTGGLIIDDGWEKLTPRNESGDILFFTYARDWTPVVKAIKGAGTCAGKKILCAAGAGQESFVKAWKKNVGEGEGGILEILPFMNQTDWDKMMKNCSFLFIRGEESLSRACLTGIPFIWHAYPQSDEYQLVKVNALLERMRRHFSEEDFGKVAAAWQAINSPESGENKRMLQDSVSTMLAMQNHLAGGFRDFALDLRKNGDLGQNLMTFIEEICIM
ncbi:elongation factor P maturation arginine rhamnosyltransferase EarP [Treponema sp. C6A8]|uniref:elongation factor P maturation arginine rhamnosyltransferase EarP n=1 Tax=Treponema sp. C6A8 TaxID=1410609 RepID=UPI000484F013|nr:elongation factor P maturation arginine rhamnosyltransferase EarP [Treponema sp. C6A8]